MPAFPLLLNPCAFLIKLPDTSMGVVHSTNSFLSGNA